MKQNYITIVNLLKITFVTNYNTNRNQFISILIKNKFYLIKVLFPRVYFDFIDLFLLFRDMLNIRFE